MLNSKVLYWGLVILTVVEIFGYLFFNDVPFCSIILLTGLSLILLAAGFPSDNWLSRTEVIEKINVIGEFPSELSNHIPPPCKIKDFNSLKKTQKFFVGEERSNASADFVEDTREAVVKTTVIYLFVLMSFLVTFLYPTEEYAEDVKHIIEKAKFWTAFIYVGIIFLYWTWQLSPAMFIKKRNRLYVKEVD